MENILLQSTDVQVLTIVIMILNTMDDGSCIYAAEGFDCAGNCLSGELLTMYDSWGDGWNGAILTINGLITQLRGHQHLLVFLLECN